jgi:hypothetical protein
MFEDMFASKPDAINEKGIHFWIDKNSNKIALDYGLKDIKVFYLKDKDYKTRVITQNGKYIYENQKLEDILVHLDIMKLSGKQTF